MDEFKQPIEIKFTTIEETNEIVFNIYLKSLTEAVNAARGDVPALERLNRLGKELAWLTDNLIFDAKRGEGK